MSTVSLRALGAWLGHGWGQKGHTHGYRVAEGTHSSLVPSPQD